MALGGSRPAGTASAGRAQASPAFTAREAAAALFGSFSLPSTCPEWVVAVRRLMPSRSATSRSVRPRARRTSTSRSRGERTRSTCRRSRVASGAGGGGALGSGPDVPATTSARRSRRAACRRWRSAAAGAAGSPSSRSRAAASSTRWLRARATGPAAGGPQAGWTGDPGSTARSIMQGSLAVAVDRQEAEAPVLAARPVRAEPSPHTTNNVQACRTITPHRAGGRRRAPRGRAAAARRGRATGRRGLGAAGRATA